MHITQNFGTVSSEKPMSAAEAGLPVRRTLWPREAQEAFSSVLRDLNAWCRDNGCPAVLNGPTAEEAVRRTWDGGRPNA